MTQITSPRTDYTDAIKAAKRKTGYEYLDTDTLGPGIVSRPLFLVELDNFRGAMKLGGHAPTEERAHANA